MSRFVLRLLVATHALLIRPRGLHKTNRAKVTVGEKAMSSSPEFGNTYTP